MPLLSSRTIVVVAKGLPAVLLVCRFDVPATTEGRWLVRARRAVELLGAQPGCLRVEIARATEEPAAWVLVAVFDTLADYRRALAPFDVRTDVVPLLFEARTDGPATFERRLTGGDGSGAVEQAPTLS